ncbi:Glycosyltransferase family 58 protein [Rhodotorula toruloides ATCC 204091]|uniref:Dol-P-Man:Man(5)GlcNAc(2)-PP-Dol alpha-1,3-mannosyltransferase n=1 Tax=Rhodotorula toruloides TaxID=5286 RepID=A0A0K3CGW9_RHOTO|nr:Glycosyltransferase family 58 protein [Rhodotorula toruloides ATCC 204091]PRQ75525.1 glycosyltransferase family 58 protein [Rhodotorula toruloides]
MYGIPPPPRLPKDAPQSKPSLSSSSQPTTSSSSRFTEIDPSSSRSAAKRTMDGEQSLVSYLLEHPAALFTDHERCFDLVATAVLLWESVLSVGVVNYIKYTEIDFSTYMQQAQAFLDGERDYSMMKGDSGPAYYPALHIYLYSAISRLTAGGKHLERAQWLFAGVYVLTMAIVIFGIYRRNPKIPPYALPLLTISKRLHSIYMLRMFNDALVMLFVYSAIALYMVPAKTASPVQRRKLERRWLFGTVLMSCALSIKMSTLLFLPALFYLLFTQSSPLTLLQHVLVLCLTQTLFALPFALASRAHLTTYLSQAFDFSRTFEWEYTMNWRWLGEEAFENPAWGKMLLVAHAAGLALWAWKWAEEDGGVEKVLRRALSKPTKKPALTALTSARIATLFFVSNLTGIVCARSLHPQFYAWFAHQGVWMVFGTGWAIEPMHGLVVLSLIEYGFSVWPSTVNSSLGLVLSLLVTLVSVYYVEADRSAVRGGKEGVVVPAEWADAEGKGGKKE